MNLGKLILLVILPCVFCVSNVRAADLFHDDNPVQAGLNVKDVSDTFAEIYEKLEDVKWGGKSLNVAIESLEKIHRDVHIAATDERVVLVWKDSIVANYPRPKNSDWDGFGQITTALVVRLREIIPSFGQMSTAQMYQTVVDALMRGVDENGRYIYSKRAEVMEDGRILTSVGLEGGREERGNFRVTGIYKDSPADTAGVKSGDLITQINGVNVREMSDADIDSVMSGFNSGTLKLGLLTPNGSKNVVIRRATIVLADADVIHRPGADTMPGLLEIVVHRVSDNSVSIINEEVARFDDIGSIILDLRSATGDD